jgi:outer membrane lipoprotein
MRTLSLILALLISGILGCTRPISKQSMALVDHTITFSALRTEPEKHVGQYVLLGGVIARVTNSQQGSELEVVQSELESRERPGDTTSSQGRFLIRTDSFLDPVIYRIGLPVTVVGIFKGLERRPLLQMEYSYPLLVMQEIHLWQPERERSSPNFHFGIGIGTVL